MLALLLHIDCKPQFKAPLLLKRLRVIGTEDSGADTVTPFCVQTYNSFKKEKKTIWDIARHVKVKHSKTRGARVCKHI